MANDRERFPDKRQAPGAPGSSGVTQNTVVLNDFGGVTFEERTRTSATGSTSVRYSLSIEAEPILNILDGVYLGAGPANAIKDILIKQTKNILAVAKPATLAARQKARQALANGKAWAVDRYAQGRAKSTPEPGSQGVRIGNDSGLLANGWYVMQNPVEQSFTVNVPASRFTPETWGGTMASLQTWIARFVSLVPALADPRSILEDETFTRAVAKSPPVVALGKGSFGQWSDIARATLSGLGRIGKAGGLF